MPMQGTRSKSVLCAIIAVAAFWLAAPFAHAIVTSSDTAVLLTGRGITLTLAAGGNLPSYSAASSTLTLNLVSGSSVTVKSADLYTMTNSQGTPTLCSGMAYSYVSFSVATSTTVTMTPTTTLACSSNAGGGGGGGGGGAAYYQLSVSKSGSGSGTVSGTSVSSNINCGSSCATSLLGGQTMTITAAAALGSVFVSWAGDCQTATGTTCSLVMNAAKSVGAVFNLASSTPSSGGSGPSGNTTAVATPPPPSVSGSPAYCLVNNTGTFYLILNGVRHGITDPGMLYSYGYGFSSAIPDTAAYQDMPTGNLLSPNDGALVKTASDPTVYLIADGQRHGFTSAQVFQSLGFRFSSVLTVTAPELIALPLGVVISDGSSRHLRGVDIASLGTVCYMGDNFRYPYPSLAVYNSWNPSNDFSGVVPASAADLALPLGAVMTARPNCAGR